MSDSKAQELVLEVRSFVSELSVQGEKALKKFLFWSPKYDVAVEAFTAAANQYKILKEFKKAGDLLNRVADCYVQLNSPHEAARAYTDAASCFKKEDVDGAIGALESAAILYLEDGKFLSAAKVEKEIAELLEGEKEMAEAVEHYQKSADYFENEESQASASTCLLKVAFLSALLGDYKQAIDVFEQVAQQCLEKNILKFNAKNHLFCAGICRLVYDHISMDRTLQSYKEMDYTFGNSRECHLLETISADVEEMDLTMFSEHLWEYDQITSLDPWKTKMFLKVKAIIVAELQGDDDDGDNEIDDDIDEEEEEEEKPKPKPKAKKAAKEEEEEEEEEEKPKPKPKAATKKAAQSDDEDDYEDEDD